MTMRAASQAVPPKINNAAQPSPAVFAGVILGTVILASSAFVFLFNPSTNGFYPVCQFHKLTGLNCPGCGATRALYALLHGNFPLALKDNALFVLTLAALAIWSARFILKKLKNRPATLDVPPKFLWGFLVVAFVFAVARNMPGFSFLSP